MLPTAQEFRGEISKRLAWAEKKGWDYLILNAGQVHRDVGGYPAPNHRMPTLCRVMMQMKTPRDEVLYRPRLGIGAGLEIKYRLPRHEEPVKTDD